MALEVRMAVTVPSQQEDNQATQRAPQLSALTGLRFLAALWVALFHFGQGGIAAVVGWRNPATTVVSNGYIGVDFFYILSGFILAYTYGTPDGALRTTRRAFYVARFARVYPVYVVGFIASIAPVVWSGTTPREALTSLMGDLLLIQPWFPAIPNPWNGPCWSVAAEAFFYALFPLLIPLFWPRQLRSSLRLISGCWLLTLAAPVAYMFLNPDHVPFTGGWFNVPWMNAIRVLPITRLPEFLFGIACGTLFVRQRTFHRTAPRWCGPLSLTAAACLLISTAILPQVPYLALHNGLLAPLFGALIYGAAWGRGPLAAVFTHPAAVALGEASYALYILHWPVWMWCMHLGLVSAQTPSGMAGETIAYLLLLTAVSLMVFACIECPARRAIRAHWG